MSVNKEWETVTNSVQQLTKNIDLVFQQFDNSPTSVLKISSQLPQFQQTVNEVLEISDQQIQDQLMSHLRQYCEKIIQILREIQMTFYQLNQPNNNEKQQLQDWIDVQIFKFTYRINENRNLNDANNKKKKKNPTQKFEKIEKILSFRIKQLENLNQQLTSNNKLILPNQIIQQFKQTIDNFQNSDHENTELNQQIDDIFDFIYALNCQDFIQNMNSKFKRFDHEEIIPNLNTISAYQKSLKEKEERNHNIKMLETSHQNCPTSSDYYLSLQAKEKISPNTPFPKRRFIQQQTFQNLDLDTLFFIFYFQKGTFEQFLASQELKNRTWRFHKKYLTWFKRLEAPKESTDDYEKGTYVFFEYEKIWCQRRKQDFTFKYHYLEDG